MPDFLRGACWDCCVIPTHVHWNIREGLHVWWQLQTLSYTFGTTVFSRTSTPPPPILTVLWFFEVLHVTAHHTKILRSEGRSAEMMLLWAPQHQASKDRTHLSVASFAAFFPCSTKLHTASDDKRCRKLATRLWISPLCSTIQLSLLSGWRWRSMDEATMHWYPLAANFACGAPPCAGIAEPFKLFLLVTPHSQFLALELQVPMGGIYIHTRMVVHIPDLWSQSNNSLLSVANNLMCMYRNSVWPQCAAWFFIHLCTLLLK